MPELAFSSESLENRSLSLRADTRLFPQLETWLEETLLRLGMPRRAVIQMLIAADEVFTNIASYAYGKSEQPGMIHVSWEVTSDQKNVRISFRDNGIAFNPLLYEQEDSTAFTQGGKGILLLKKYADALDYKREENDNILTLTKSIV